MGIHDLPWLNNAPYDRLTHMHTRYPISPESKKMLIRMLFVLIPAFLLLLAYLLIALRANEQGARVEVMTTGTGSFFSAHAD